MLQIYKTKDVKTPERKGRNAGFDFFVPEDYPTTHLLPRGSITIPSGIKVRLPEGYVLIAFNKSGLAANYKLHVGACVVDENYTGEIHLDVHNRSYNEFLITPGLKLMQFILIKQVYHEVVEIESEDELYANFNTKERGRAGFGSTGI